MDLLETILRTAHAVSYLELFRKSSIDCSTLQTLSDRDLEIIGVDDPEVRNLILKRTSTLIIPKETNVNFVYDDKYVNEVLGQASRNLQQHYACIICAIARKDVVLCDVQLSNASKTLLNCLSSFEKEVELLEQKIKKKGMRRNKFWNFVGGFVVFGTSTLSVFLIRKFVLK